MTNLRDKPAWEELDEADYRAIGRAAHRQLLDIIDRKQQARRARDEERQQREQERPIGNDKPEGAHD